METWQSWALFLGCAGGLAYYYYPHDKNPMRTRSTGPNLVAEPAPKSTSSRRHDKKSAPKAKGTSAAPQSAPNALSDKAESIPNGTAVKSDRNKKRRTGLAPEVRTPQVVLHQSPPVEDGDNGDWAKELAAAQRGVTMKSQDKVFDTNRGKRTGGKGKPKVLAASPDLSNASSAGFEADDDYTPVTSPENKITSDSNPSGRDVSDMLEAPAPGPSVLRLTGETNPTKKQIPRAAPPAPLTKKQRQRREKAEQLKAAREEGEIERQALLEQQRRRAREARGEPAKNGLTPSKAPQSNAWNVASSKIDSSGIQSSARDLPLLDTFEPDTASTTSSNEVGMTGQSSATTMSLHDLPPEEEQIRLISRMNGDDGWNEVGGKKQKKKKDATQSNTEALAQSTEQPKQQPKALSKDATEEKLKAQGYVQNGWVASEQDVQQQSEQRKFMWGSNGTSNGHSSYNPVTGGHILDSDWTA